MAIPKLKVYRLNQSYDSTNDNDMQYLSDDEMLPISPKNLNPLMVEEMVGVRERRDARMVVESDWKITEFDINNTVYASNAIETLTKECDNWVLGKGNIRVFVKKVLKSSVVDSSSSSSSSDLPQNLFEECTTGNGWYELDRKFWDYQIKTIKKYYYENEENKLVSTEQPLDFQIKQIHQINEIYFKIGNMLISSTEFYTSGYESYIPINGNDAINKIIIMYKTFRELNSTDYLMKEEVTNLFDLHEINNNFSSSSSVENQTVSRSLNSDYSKYRVPFGNIYNGNKEGRCFFYRKDDNQPIYTSSVYNTKYIMNQLPHYYEGNYMYKKKVMPLRVLVAKQKSWSSDFVADCLIENGTCEFNADYDWYVDGLMKPVLMQKITVYNQDGTSYKIFKALEQNVQYTMIFQDGQGQSDNKIKYKISFIDNYYEVNKQTIYPKQVFLFYNKVGDSLGNIFDFNYDYRQFCSKNGNSLINKWQEDSVIFKEYGYANRGNLILNNDYYNLFSSKENILYKKDQVLAVQEGYGYQEDKDLLLVQKKILDEQTGLVKDRYLQFQFNTVPGNLYYNKFYTNDLGYKIYINGKLIEDTTKLKQEELSSSSSQTQNDFRVSFEIITETEEETKCYLPTWTIERINKNIDLPKDLMLVFYEKHEILTQSYNTNVEDSQGNYIHSNPVCIGYRIPCYEKVKTANLFVSSFPNWVKGHLNNDLDVFVGNITYSGTALDESNIEAIYPCYSDEGWYAMYSEGSIQFAQYQTEYDYFDVFNYGSQMGTFTVDKNDWDTIVKNVLPNYLSSEIKNSYKIYYNKIKYNVAYYDGIYAVVRSKLSNYSIQNGGSHYALLQDDDFKDSIGKKWVLRDDNYIRFLYESGLVELPEKIKISNEQTSILKEFTIRDGQFFRVDTTNNRITVINFQPSYSDEFGNSMIVCLNISTTQEKNKIDSAVLTDNDIRVHVKINDYKMYIGLQHEETCDIFQGAFMSSSSTNDIDDLTSSSSVLQNNKPICNCNKQISVDASAKTNYFTLPNIKWYCLAPLEDCYDDLDISEVHTNVQDIGEEVDESENKILKRYKYHNKDWGYDVYFEVFSYRYSQNKDAEGKYAVQSVEYIVYKVDK